MHMHNAFKAYHLSAFSAQSDINLDPTLPAELACAEYRQTWPLHTKAYITYLYKQHRSYSYTQILYSVFKNV